jgi:succinate dehydrogenase / fumarate reductase, cytochrome b subunit
MASIITTLWQGVRYRGGIGHWAYQFHRLAGLATLLFLGMHILDTSTVYFFPELYGHAIELYRSTPFMLSEIALMAAVLYHGFNGLKIIVFDFWPRLWTHEREAKATWAVMIGTFIIWLPAALWMGNTMVQCNFLHLCGE